jgi:hypothetical protein
MGVRTLVTKGPALGLILAAACSKPGNVADQAAKRDINLPSTAEPSAAVASDVELGVRLRATETPRPAGRPANHPAPIAPVEAATAPSAEIVSALTVNPKISNGLASSATVSEGLATAPMATMGLQLTGRFGGSGNQGSAVLAGLGQHHGPTIMIRGGHGGIDDDCDLNRPTIMRPSAIHSVLPPVGYGRRRGR